MKTYAEHQAEKIAELPKELRDLRTGDLAAWDLYLETSENIITDPERRSRRSAWQSARVAYRVRFRELLPELYAELDGSFALRSLYSL